MSIAWLDNSRIIAIFAVILLHAVNNLVTGSAVGSESWWTGNFYSSFVRWCVPVFVMVSGALLLDPDKHEDLKGFYTKRVTKIAIPLLFWSAFFLFWVILKGALHTWIDLFWRLALGMPYYHMWFLYMIILLYIFTPFFRKILAASTRTEIEIFVIITFLIAVVYAVYAVINSIPTPLFIFRFLPYIPYFFLGLLIRTDPKSHSKIILGMVFVFSSLLTGFGCYTISIYANLNFGLYFYDYLSITVIPMSVSAMYLLKSWNTPMINAKFARTVSILTLGVYLIHPVVMETVIDLGFGHVKYIPANAVPLVTVIVFCLSLFAAWILSRLPYIKRVI